MSDRPTVTIDVNGCARCDNDHRDVLFTRLTRPFQAQPTVPPHTHWAPCPSNGEPILLQISEVPLPSWRAMAAHRAGLAIDHKLIQDALDRLRAQIPEGYTMVGVNVDLPGPNDPQPTRLMLRPVLVRRRHGP